MASDLRIKMHTNTDISNETACFKVLKKWFHTTRVERWFRLHRTAASEVGREKLEISSPHRHLFPSSTSPPSFDDKDLLVLKEEYTTRPASEETITDPTNPKHYWRYHMYRDSLLKTKLSWSPLTYYLVYPSCVSVSTWDIRIAYRDLFFIIFLWDSVILRCTCDAGIVDEGESTQNHH